MIEIIWNNLIAFPANVWNDLLWFLGLFYDPSQGVLENIIFNELLWVGIPTWIWFQNGGSGAGYLILTAVFLWLLFKTVIIFMGIELFAILLVTIIVFSLFKVSRREASQRRSNI